LFVQVLQDEIDTHREPMRRVDLTGTYLKYLGSRADICELGHHLMTVRLRWKRLVQHAAEIKRQLWTAYHETKRVNINILHECHLAENSLSESHKRSVITRFLILATDLQNNVKRRNIVPETTILVSVSVGVDSNSSIAVDGRVFMLVIIVVVTLWRCCTVLYCAIDSRVFMLVIMVDVTLWRC